MFKKSKESLSELFDEPIYVTKPFLPPIEDFVDGLQSIWASQWLTNDGPVHQRFEGELSRRLGTDNVCLFNNGTLALQLGLQGMGITGEVITTPFTFVATTHALYANKIRPVFVDIDPDTYNMDPDKVEAAITPWTTAILGVHVFGNPCNIEALADIARRHNIKLIFDAAHAFGVEVGGRSIAHCGDMSMFSFHATKVFHSLEGGMLVFRDSALKQTFDYLKNFGFEGETEVVMPGTNAKMNEIQALMGVTVLEHIDRVIEKGRAIAERYKERLSGIPGLRFQACREPEATLNYSYFPVEVVEDEFGMSRDDLFYRLREFKIIVRRYFYPLVCDYSCYKQVPVSDPLSVARGVSSRILTLPTYFDLKLEDVDKICDVMVHLSNS